MFWRRKEKPYVMKLYEIVTFKILLLRNNEVLNTTYESTGSSFFENKDELIRVSLKQRGHRSIVGTSINELEELYRVMIFAEDVLCYETPIEKAIERSLPKGSHVLSKEQTKLYCSGKCIYIEEPNLLEIKLKDTDSVPEVYYKGERLDSMPCGLVDISYHYHTTGDRPDGTNDIHIDYYDGEDTTFPDMKTIGHKRTI